MTPATVNLVAAAVFGLIIGSFLNVVIYRLPLGQSLVTPPSRCRKCGYSLRWFDNVPVLSWVLLRGRCRKCGTGVSWQYPLVELITSILFVITVWLTPVGPLLASRLVLVCILIALFGIDLEHPVHVLGEVHHDRDVAALPGQAGAAPAGDHRRAERARGRHGMHHVVQIARQDDADRHLAVVGAVGGVEGSAALVEAHLTPDPVRERPGQARAVHPAGRAG